MKFKNLPTVKDTTTSSETVSSTTKYTVDEVDTNVIYVSYGSSTSSTAIRAKITLNLEDHTFTTSAWQHTVTFDYNYIEEGETESKKISATGYHGVSLWFSSVKNEKDERIDEITREGYIFDGWYDNPECTGSEVRSSVSNTEDTVLYAKWVVPVTITIHANNGTEDTVLTGKPESFVTGLSNPTREGYIFDGWYTDEACTTTWNKYYGTENINVYAKWVEPWNYSSYVGTYKGAEVWSSNTNSTPSVSYTVKISESGSYSGRGTADLNNAVRKENGQVSLNNSYKMAAVEASDGRKFLVTHWNGFNSSFVSTDIALYTQVFANETVTVKYTAIVASKSWACEVTVANSDTGTSTVYKLFADSTTQLLHVDVNFVIDGVENSPLSSIYNGSYAESIVIKKGEETVYSNQ